MWTGGDDLQAGITAGNIIEENHYYAYGLKIATLSSTKLGDGYEGELKNNYLYQGAYSELDDDIGWQDFAFRNYDAQIGRWVQQDPFDEFASPYVGMGDDPVNLTDPSGGFTLGGLTKGGTAAILTLGGAIIGTAVDLISGGDGFTGTLIGAGAGLGLGLGNMLKHISAGMCIQTANAAVTAINLSINSNQVGRQLSGSNSGLNNNRGHGPFVSEENLIGNESKINQTPAEKFKSMNEAAIDWGKKYNDNSIKDGREYVSTIYRFKKNGKTYYSYTTPKKGSGGTRAAIPLPAPKGTTAVARIHSHGNSWGENPGVVAADNNFSTNDKWVYYNNNVDGYVTTPNGSLKKYDYRTTKVTVVSTNMPSDTKYPKLRKNKIDFDKLPKNEPSLL